MDERTPHEIEFDEQLRNSFVAIEILRAEDGRLVVDLISSGKIPDEVMAPLKGRLKVKPDGAYIFYKPIEQENLREGKAYGKPISDLGHMKT